MKRKISSSVAGYDESTLFSKSTKEIFTMQGSMRLQPEVCSLKNI
jgi:hypothetical protein